MLHSYCLVDFRHNLLLDTLNATETKHFWGLVTMANLPYFTNRDQGSFTIPSLLAREMDKFYSTSEISRLEDPSSGDGMVSVQLSSDKTAPPIANFSQ